MKLNISSIVILLASSLFCGVFIISLGIGAEFTAVNTVMSSAGVWHGKNRSRMAI